jgi:hypothetical protein
MMMMVVVVVVIILMLLLSIVKLTHNIAIADCGVIKPADQVMTQSHPCHSQKLLQLTRVRYSTFTGQASQYCIY